MQPFYCWLKTVFISRKMNIEQPMSQEDEREYMYPFYLYNVQILKEREWVGNKYNRRDSVALICWYNFQIGLCFWPITEWSPHDKMTESSTDITCPHGSRTTALMVALNIQNRGDPTCTGSTIYMERSSYSSTIPNNA